MFKLKRIAEICSRFAGKKILVYGDVILDRYIFGQVERISPEAPVPVVTVEQRGIAPGRRRQRGGQYRPAGRPRPAAGRRRRDGFAAEIARLKPTGNLVIRDAEQPDHRQDADHFPAPADRPHRPRRADPPGRRRSWSGSGPRSPRAGIDGIIVSDYAKGTVNAEVMALLKARAVAGGIPIVVDPKPPHFDLYRGVTGITPNLKEAEEMTGKRHRQRRRRRPGPEPHPPQIPDPLHPDHPGQPGDLGRREEPQDVPPAGVQP